jgi:hypothetical protein
MRQDLRASFLTLTEQIAVAPLKFAVYRHSRNFYDPDEWVFLGAGYVDGTVVGAMKAGMEAYPM